MHHFYYGLQDQSLGMLCTTWALWTFRGVPVPQGVAAGRAGGEVLGHLALMEAGLRAVVGVTGAQQLGLPLGVRAPGGACGQRAAPGGQSAGPFHPQMTSLPGSSLKRPQLFIWNRDVLVLVSCAAR